MEEPGGIPLWGSPPGIPRAPKGGQEGTRKQARGRTAAEQARFNASQRTMLRRNRQVSCAATSAFHEASCSTSYRDPRLQYSAAVMGQG